MSKKQIIRKNSILKHMSKNILLRFWIFLYENTSQNFSGINNKKS